MGAQFKIYVFLLVIVLAGCKRSAPRELTYNEIDYQRSLNGKYKIYRYCKSGTFSFSGDVCGTVLLKNNEDFSENASELINDMIGGWVSPDTLLVYKFRTGPDQPKDTVGQTSYAKLSDLVLEIKTYGPPNSAGLNEYFFDTYEIHENLITFTGLTPKFGPKISATQSYLLGNVKAINNADTLSKIEIKNVATSMTFRYHNKDGSITDSLPEVKILVIDFYPRQTTKKISPDKTHGVFFDSYKKT